MPLFTIRGIVVKNIGRGGDLGFPTANLRCLDEIPEGIYTGETEVIGREGLLPSLVFIGKALTFGAQERFTEVHILDFSDVLYGKELRVTALQKIRDNQKFDTQDDLIAAMREDERIARKFFAT